MKKVAIYVRVSTDKQTVENQLRELRQIAERRGSEVVKEYHDAGISGSKAWKRVPGLMKCSRTLNGAGSMWSRSGRLIGSVAR
jgi:DNA invertase Pin-like site-specific DNA recombinase